MPQSSVIDQPLLLPYAHDQGFYYAPYAQCCLENIMRKRTLELRLLCMACVHLEGSMNCILKLAVNLPLVLAPLEVVMTKFK